MLHWEIEKKRLNLIYSWKISRNESDFKDNYFIRVSGNSITAWGEAAPNIRYGESPEKIKNEFDQFLKSEPGKTKNIEELTILLDSLGLSNSLRFGIESAFIHWHCRKNNISLFDYFQLPPVKGIPTSYTVPIMKAEEAKDFLKKHQLRRFKSIKIKISTEESDLIRAIAEEYKGPLRIDANEAFHDPDNLLLFSEKIKDLNIEFIEQPFPSALKDEYRYLKKKSPWPVLGDESITSQLNMEELAEQFDGINMKLMKAGGYLKGIKILKEAKKYGMKTMTGCMVETTLGISSGMHLCGISDYADLDGFFVIENEPFGMVEEKDGKLLFRNKEY